MAKVDDADWSNSVKGVLLTQQTTYSYANIQLLIKLIERRHKEIIHHNQEYEAFYSSFVALATQYICAGIGCVPKASILEVCKACRVIMEFLLPRLEQHHDNCTLSKKHMVMLLSGLCKGSLVGSFPKSDLITFSALLKSAPAPEFCAVTDAAIHASNDSSESDQEVPAVAAQKQRCRASAVTSSYLQMTSVFNDAPALPKSARFSSLPVFETPDTTTAVHTPVGPTAGSEMVDTFAFQNVSALHQLGGCDMLLEICDASLVYLKRYRAYYDDEMKGNSRQESVISVSDAVAARLSLQSVSNDIAIVWRIFSLPVLEPLTRARLEKIVSVTMSCVYASIAAVTTTNMASTTVSSGQTKSGSTSKDDETDVYASTIVQKTIEIFNWVSTTICNSSKAGGHVLQNFHMIGAWCLLRGLQNLLQTNVLAVVDKSKDVSGAAVSGKPKPTADSSGTGAAVTAGKSRDQSLVTTRTVGGKVHGGFGPLMVALVSHLVTLMKTLMSDLQVESLSSVKSDAVSGAIKEAELALFNEYTAMQRVRKIVSCINLPNFLISLLGLSFKKGLLLGKSINHSEGGMVVDAGDDAHSNSSDSNTFYEEDFSSSEDEDDDSEPILGQWFEETLSPGDVQLSEMPAPSERSCSSDTDGTNVKQSRRHSSTDSLGQLLPDKKEPDAYFILATDILNFIREYFLKSNNAEVKACISESTLTEQHMQMLAVLIRDLDRERPMDNTGEIYFSFSVAMSYFIHALISGGTLSDSLQEMLLHHLGIGLHSALTEPWPLHVCPRTLAVLAEILLLHQQSEHDATALANPALSAVKRGSEIAIIHVWTRLMTTLADMAISLEPTTPASEVDDINVEHLQLAVFLFHSGLTLMQKKSLWLQLCQSVLRIAMSYTNSSSRMHNVFPLPLTRLLLLIDYLLHYFYDMPSSLAEQIQYNLFDVFAGKKEESVDAKDASVKRHFICSNIEEALVKMSGSGSKSDVAVSIKPRFYNLASAEYSNQETPKVDGLACSFLLSNPELLNYDEFYNAVVAMVAVGSQRDKFLGTSWTLLDACCVHYHFNISWRLLGCLPLSADFLRRLESGIPPRVSDGPALLHTIKWTSRLPQKIFQVWVKDYLVKQTIPQQKAESLISGAVENTSSLQYNILLSERCLAELAESCLVFDPKAVLPLSDLPSVSTLYTLDVLLAYTQISLDDQASRTAVSEVITPPNSDVASRLLPSVLALISKYAANVRSYLLGQVSGSGETSLSPSSLQAFNCVARISSYVNTKLNHGCMINSLPVQVRGVFEKWNAVGMCSDFPAVLAWHSSFGNDLIPAESYIDAVREAHLSAAPPAGYGALLRHIMNTLVNVAVDLATVWGSGDASIALAVADTLVPLTSELIADSLSDSINSALEKLVGPSDSEEMMSRPYAHVVPLCRDLIIDYLPYVDEQIVQECLQFLELGLDHGAARVVMEKIFAHSDDLLTILLSANGAERSAAYGTCVLKFFNKLIKITDTTPANKSCVAMCSSLRKLADLDSSVLQEWLGHMVVLQSGANAEGSKVSENRELLRSLTQYIVKESSLIGTDVASAILAALIPMGSQVLTSDDVSSFRELMEVMRMLAGTYNGSGHIVLYPAAIEWLGLCHQALSVPSACSASKNVQPEPDDRSSSHRQSIILSASCLLDYVSCVLAALKQVCATEGRSIADASHFSDNDIPVGSDAIDSDGMEEMAQDDDESTAEESDDESLNSKLCTYTITQKEFMNQHWYHCHTCKMVDGVGVCTICAKICHKDHDLSYAKYGSFFCDCGAKEDVRCQALTKRTSGANRDSSQPAMASTGPAPFGTDVLLKTSGVTVNEKQRDAMTSSSYKETLKANRPDEQLIRQIETCKEVLLSYLSDGRTMQLVLDLLQLLLPSIAASCQQTTAYGSLARAQKALRDLRTLTKSTEMTDNLMVATLGSQEGAFENVRVNYSGDQGQTIRQLLTSHVLRRISMCALSSPFSRRQHLAISNEKGKVTILQLSALLKQAQSSKRKLTLTRLTSAPIPFTVLTVAGNPSNEDYLAVCGLKDCHVLTFSSSGTVADHLVLHPALETGNFIIKAVWLPGSQTELAIITADFVKIYDLATDAISPQFYFLLLSGKIRDATFLMGDNERHLLLMSSTGYVYEQVMDASSRAQHGPFYITNVLDIKHSDIKESGGQLAGGGVSLHYSHALQLLFFSYAQGKSFAAPLQKNAEVGTLFPINFKSSNGAKSGSGSQPLVQWTEVHGHAGLVCALTQTSNTPIVMMVTPDSIRIQEVRIQPAKAKIQDMVVIRHAGSGAGSSDLRTTLILLCEDGSLRIYMANVEQTNFWMQPTMHSASLLVTDSPSKPVRKRKSPSAGRSAGQTTFSVDFFEHCQQSNDVEFGGNDVLQVYNTAQVKHRLNTTGMYIASTKANGFSIDVTNTAANTVMVGVRVLVGSQAVERAPSTIELFGRSHPVSLTRHRWYDLPFTREESLTADKKFTISFGQSVDPSGVTMVDSVKVYTKTKEAFGWPEDSDDSSDSTLTKTPPAACNASSAETAVDTVSGTIVASPAPMTVADKLIASAVEVLEGFFSTATINADDVEPAKQKAIALSTKLLTLPVPNVVQHLSKSLLSSLFSSRASFYWHKDLAQLQEAAKCLIDFRESREIDPEAFERLIYIARTVAVFRPNNLVLYADKHFVGQRPTVAPDVNSAVQSSSDEQCEFVTLLNDAFWYLHASRPVSLLTAPACMPGLMQIDLVVPALVEVLHAFTYSSRDLLPVLCRMYSKLLLFEDLQVSFACNHALIRVMRSRSRRRRATVIPTPPHCSSPGDLQKDRNGSGQPSDGVLSPSAENYVVADPVEQAGGGMPAEGGANNASAANALEALLAGGAGNLQALLNLPDADDETMVQLAIALSLQDQAGPGAPLNLSNNLQSGPGIEAGQLSDATASGPTSDDEAGSTAVTDGSALQASPVERGGSGAGSDSSGSQVGSVSGVDGETTGLSVPADGENLDGDYEYYRRMQSLRLRMLDQLVLYVAELKTVGGVRAIPFLQLTLSLILELDEENDKDKATLDSLLSVMLTKLLDLSGDVTDMAVRTPQHEVQLVVLRLVSVLMSRTRSSNKLSAESFSYINAQTGRALMANNGVDYCLRVLRILLEHWKATASKEPEGTAVNGQLLRPRAAGSPPDMAPFFLRQYVKSHANNVFEDYPLLLMEIVLRLPYQMKKIAEGCVLDTKMPAFDNIWYKVLTEYMITQPPQVQFVRRQVRKLLLYICGSKEKYRQLRDMQFLETHMSNIRSICEKCGLDMVLHSTSGSVSVSYDVLITLIDHLKSCLEIATSRTINWQKFCAKEEGVLLFLVLASVGIDNGIAPLILQLLQCALCGSKGVEQASTSAGSSAASMLGTAVTASTASPAKSKASKEKREDRVDSKNVDVGSSKKEADDVSRHDEALCNSLVQLVCKSVGRELLVRFIVCFLLESNQASVRWQAHALILHIYRSSPASQREALLELMWSVWHELPVYGSKASQFVDLLGYFTIKTPHTSEQKVKLYVERALALLKVANKTLASHPNGSIYNVLQGLVDFDGYYLERDPCLVCNNPEVPFTNIKLAAVKVDSKFTTSTQIIKLSCSHNISKITVKISDIKRAKMVRSLVVHYNNRQVQAVVELKNKPGLWHKAKKVVLTAGQAEVKIEFPLPIVACNLMIEYADFYDNIQASAETLQCPRCSASVPANPGVCGNCGENVFQCHKCRAINYDEKDPFLCNACGYCKYAKFDFTLTARPCCAVDPIENDDDRKKAVTTINALLDKADHQYRLLQSHKASLDTLLVSITDHSSDRPEDVSSVTTSTSGAQSSGQTSSNAHSANNAPAASSASSVSAINKNIQHLAQKYCGDCRNAFDELSKIIQKVLASRKELVEYDRQQQEAAQSATVPMSGSGTPAGTPTLSPKASQLFAVKNDVRSDKPREKRLHCYGCTSATIEHCITLLRAMVTNQFFKNLLCSKELIHELIDYNLRRGTASLRSEVRHLLCLMSTNNASATDELIELLTKRVNTAIDGHLSNPDIAATVRHEMLLFSNMLHLEDNLWEQRVRCVLKLFIMSMDVHSPAVLECISLPCLRILHHIIKPSPATSQKNKDKPLESLCTVRPVTADLHVDIRDWLAGKPAASFAAWKRRMPTKLSADNVTTGVTSSGPAVLKKRSREKEQAKESVHVQYLMEKYGMRWRIKVAYGTHRVPFKLIDTAWIRTALFSPSSSATRQTQCNIIETLCSVPYRKKDILDMLSSFLEDVGTSGESSAEFLALYKKLFAKDHWKYYLAVKGVLVRITGLITKEIEELSRLEETSLSSDLSQGYALKSLTDLLAAFLEVDNIKHHYKNRLVGSVLNGYLSLRKLVVQRTKMIDETQDKLLELLEEMTTGTESETKEFMSVCVETVSKYPLSDFVSPVFIFERLCSIIFPEANDTSEFFMTLEKDPQQEDFLQGRMLGNPYSSNEVGLGPLMRDVKNKICQDCELVALLEDDNGMELLVCNKIISLDLPVKDVHRKVWAAEHGENEAMRVVYRMRGLLGDATEDMINTLETNKDEDVDNEEVYKMANVMAHCGGLHVMLNRLAAIRNLVTGKQLMTVLLKLFGLCLKVKANRQELLKLEMKSISIMLGALNLALLAEQESGASTKGQTLTEQILQIMETVLLEASSQPPDVHKEFSKLCGDKDQLIMLLDRINSPFVRANTNILQALMKLIPFLAFGDREKMQALVTHFQPYLDFNKYDFEHTQDEQIHLDCFCVIALGIESNANGRKLKDLIAEHRVVRDTIHYIQMHTPQLLKNDNDSWKEFISKPSLPFVLRLLTGLCRDHESTQLEIGREILPILHSLEQTSSDEHIGSLAENLLEALKQNVQVAAQIEDVRQQTKAEKKRLAMAMRQKQLGQLGFMTNERGQVTVKGSVLKQMEDLKEETGLICCICREGYRYQPTKVLGIYTFTKRVSLDDAEMKPRRAQGYSTVSHFNVIHVDCHLAAVRHARGREEWESAALQNGNTKCNGLLPLWGPQVPESAYASCLARHNTYLQECTGVRDSNYTYTVHDLKHLLLKFALEKSFSDDSGGGGRESNMYLIPYIMHMALYVINTTRSVAREEKNFSNFLKLPLEKWIENSFETEGPLYWAVMAVHIFDQDTWKKVRLQLLSRIIVLSHVRHLSPGGTTSITDKTIKDYSVYKPHLMFFGLVNYMSTILLSKCNAGPESNWSSALAEFIRNNDQLLQDNARKILSSYEQELLQCESVGEYCDVVGLLDEIPDPDGLISDVLHRLP